jgi:uncharacterized membrane protein
MTTAGPQPTLQRRRWVRPLIWLSVALNLLFLGLLLGAAWRFSMGAPGGPRLGGAGQMLGFVSSLPKERRDAVLRDANFRRGELRELRRTAREAARERFQALTTEPFDRARVEAAQARLNAAEARLREVTTNLLLSAASAMTPEERRKFARWRGPPERDEDEPRGRK